MTEIGGVVTPDEWVEVPEDPAALLEEFERRRWGDSLPVIPPTEARVEAMLGGLADQADKVLGVMPPGMREITPAKVAANAVMAGCSPGVLPVLLAAIDALMEPTFNLNGVQTTTHPVAPLLIVHGAAARTLGVDGGAGVFGAAVGVNVTLGRALRLVLLNIGGARPGEQDRATQGQPSKIALCMAENVEDSPWPAYIEETAGFDPDTSAVTVFGGENPHNVNDHVSTSALGVLTTLASCVATMGANSTYYTQGEVFVVLGPEHAHTIADDGLDRADVQAFLYDEARLPVEQLRRGGMWGMQAFAPWVDAIIGGDADHKRVPVVRRPDDFHVLVAGGAGKHSSVFPGFGATRAATRTVDEVR